MSIPGICSGCSSYVCRTWKKYHLNHRMGKFFLNSFQCQGVNSWAVLQKTDLEKLSLHASSESGITIKKCPWTGTNVVVNYTPSLAHSCKETKNRLGNSFFIEFLCFQSEILGCCKNQFWVVIFASLSFFFETR